MLDPVRIFIGATPAEWLPARVLEFSIREHTQLPVQLSFLYESDIEIPMPENIDNRPRTPFSFQRFLIPQICDYSGRAIYLDADMQVFKDIGRLWNQPFSECDLQAVRGAGDDRRDQFSVMLLNCEQLDWNIQKIAHELDSGILDYHGLMYDMKVAAKIGRDIPSDWNSLETFDAESTALLHYTDMNRQPWVNLENPHGYLWIACLRRAISTGFINKKEIENEIKSGHTRPSILEQLDSQIDDTLALPKVIKNQDIGFTAPYQKLNGSRFSRLRNWRSASRTLLGISRRCCHKLNPCRFFE